MATQRVTAHVQPADRVTGAHRGPVRVMHVVYTFRTGGMEMGVLKLVNELDPRLVTSAICSTTPAGEIKTLVDPRVPVFELQRRPGFDPAIVGSLKRLFVRERPHIVHTHAWGTLLEGLVAARLAGVPVVVHGEHGTLQLRPHQRLAQRIGWSAADRVLSVSSVLAARMAETTGFPPARITTIRNGVNLARFTSRPKPEARAALGLPATGTLAGTVGRLVPVKDQGTLVAAIGTLRRRGLPVELVIAGDGPERQALEQRASAEGLTGAFHLLGYRRDVETVLASLDLFVLSSVSEGLSTTILEAMAAGLPVVATQVGGAEEMIQAGETGLLVPPSDVAALADTAGRVLADHEMRLHMGAAARRRVEAEFTLAGMIARYERLYLDLAEEKQLELLSATTSEVA